MPTPKQDREREKIRRRKANRATYDLPPELRAALKTLAEEQHLPASQLVTLALLRFLREYQRGEIQLGRYKEPSRSPRYEWNLAFPAELLAAMRPALRPTPRRKPARDRED